MAYDAKCYELAEHFLRGEPTESETQYKLLCDALAIAIQTAVELWMQGLEDKPADTPPSGSPPPAAA